MTKVESRPTAQESNSPAHSRAFKRGVYMKHLKERECPPRSGHRQGEEEALVGVNPGNLLADVFNKWSRPMLRALIVIAALSLLACGEQGRTAQPGRGQGAAAQ